MSYPKSRRCSSLEDSWLRLRWRRSSNRSEEWLDFSRDGDRSGVDAARTLGRSIWSWHKENDEHLQSIERWMLCTQLARVSQEKRLEMCDSFLGSNDRTVCPSVRDPRRHRWLWEKRENNSRWTTSTVNQLTVVEGSVIVECFHLYNCPR